MHLKKLSHHAYCLIGDNTIVSELILILEKNHSIKTRGNPDFFNKKYENFTIDDAREIKSHHETMPVTEAGKKIFIINMNGITAEAQNAMLKLLEEPADYAHFFLIISSPHLLLSTVRSRLQFVEIESGVNNGKFADIEVIRNEEAKKFLKMSVAKRLEFVKTLIDKIKDEKKTKQDVIDFLNNIQGIIYEEKGIKKGQKELETIEIARKYMNDPAPSLKMLLEYVAINIKN